MYIDPCQMLLCWWLHISLGRLVGNTAGEPSACQSRLTALSERTVQMSQGNKNTFGGLFVCVIVYFAWQNHFLKAHITYKGRGDCPTIPHKWGLQLLGLNLVNERQHSWVMELNSSMAYSHYSAILNSTFFQSLFFSVKFLKMSIYFSISQYLHYIINQMWHLS